MLYHITPICAKNKYTFRYDSKETEMSDVSFNVFDNFYVIEADGNTTI